MTIQQLYIFNALYLVIYAVVSLLTRATIRRVIGSFAGAAVFGVVALGMIALGEKIRLWHMAITWEPYYVFLMLIGFALGGFIYLVTWRIARRFGWGLCSATFGPSRLTGCTGPWRNAPATAL